MFDAWFASAENMVFIKHEQERDFICPLKTNRKVAVSLAAKLAGQFQRVDTLELAENATREVYLEGVAFPLLVVRQVFTNGDGSIGILYLVTSDTTLSFDDITTSYQRRWQVECYHKSLKPQRLVSQVSDANSNHANQSFLCRLVRLHQTGDAQS